MRRKAKAHRMRHLPGRTVVPRWVLHRLRSAMDAPAAYGPPATPQPVHAAPRAAPPNRQLLMLAGVLGGMFFLVGIVVAIVAITRSKPAEEPAASEVASTAPVVEPPPTAPPDEPTRNPAAHARYRRAGGRASRAESEEGRQRCRRCTGFELERQTGRQHEPSAFRQWRRGGAGGAGGATGADAGRRSRKVAH